MRCKFLPDWFRFDWISWRGLLLESWGWIFLWFMTSSSFMLSHVTRCCTFVVTFSAAVRLVSSVSSFVYLYGVRCCGFEFTEGAAVWFDASMFPFVHSHLLWLGTFVVTEWAAEWFVISMGYFLFIKAFDVEDLPHWKQPNLYDETTP